MMTTFDVTGGYDPLADFLLATQPDNPAMRESVSFWISDDEGRFGFPRFCVETVAASWNHRGVEANIAFPDGRVLIGADGFDAAEPKITNGRAVTLSAGPLTFEVNEPLRRWTMTFDGEAYETTVQGQMRGEKSGPRKKVHIVVQAVMAVPPWTPGEQAVRAGDNTTALAIGSVGGQRHEQLFRCEGSFQIDGEAARGFRGTGLRIRRTGVRVMTNFPGHCWQSAVFPSGKAFGMVAFPPRVDGTPAYGEGFIFDGERKHYARVIEAPWMTCFRPHGEAVDVVLETASGRVRIAGKTHDSTFIAKGNPMFGNWSDEGTHTNVQLPFHQGGVLYSWDGEQAYGMIERSYPDDQVALDFS